MSYPRYSVFDKFGQYITDLSAQSIRSYTLTARGVVGECDMKLSVYDQKNKKKYLNWGNYLLIRQAGLPDWIGIFYTPRNWPFRGTLHKAYQVEKVLAWRATQAQKLTGTPGNLFRQTLLQTNSALYNEKIIYPDSIYEAGGVNDETFGGDALFHMNRVSARVGHDFAVNYSFDDNNKIYLTGSWYQRQGYDTNHFLREGYNLEISQNALQENGELYNYYIGMNDASTPSMRLSTVAYDIDAISEFGLYQKSFVASGVTVQSTLDTMAQLNVLSTKNGYRVLDLVALNVGDTYNHIRVGNTVNVDYNTSAYTDDGFGLSETAKIIGFEVDDLVPEKVRIAAEVVTS